MVGWLTLATVEEKGRKKKMDWVGMRWIPSKWEEKRKTVGISRAWS